MTTDVGSSVSVQETPRVVFEDTRTFIPERYIDEKKVTYYNMEEFPGFAWGEKWGTMTIDSLGVVDQPLYNGDELEVLDYGVGRAYFSFFPGQGSNCVMCFHVNRMKELYFLEDIQLGASIVINAKYGTYKYKVTATDVFESYDPSLLQRDEGDMLTIYTCYPKEGPYRLKRFAVTAMLVENESDPQWR